jgi:hypothetical protein
MPATILEPQHRNQTKAPTRNAVRSSHVHPVRGYRACPTLMGLLAEPTLETRQVHSGQGTLIPPEPQCSDHQHDPNDRQATLVVLFRDLE